LGIHCQITFFTKTSGFFSKQIFFQFNPSMTKLDEISFEIIATLPNKKKDDRNIKYEENTCLIPNSRQFIF
jgi:hypothetical protein